MEFKTAWIVEKKTDVALKKANKNGKKIHIFTD